MLEREREEIVAACRRLAAAGFVPRASGNMSARAGEHFAVTGAGTSLAELTADQVVVCDLAGERVAGDLEPTSELRMHVALYARADVGAIVHTHAPVATALACVLDGVPAVHDEFAALGEGPVPVVTYARAGSQQLANAAAAALAGRSSVLLANHGTVTTGPDLATAVACAELLERACELHLRSAPQR